MAQIPTVRRSDVIPVNGVVQVNESALQAPNRAAEALAQGGRDVAKFFEEFAIRKMNAQNAADIADADRKMKEGFATYQMEIAKQGDENKWEEGWSRQLDALKKEVFNDNLSPAVRDQLEIKWGDYASDTRIKIQNQVTTRSIQRSKAKMELSVESDLENGDIESAKAKIDEGVSVGLYTPEEAATRLSNAETRVDYYNASALAQSDPEGVYELLKEQTPTGRYRNFTNLRPEQRKSLMAYSRQEAGRAQSDYYAEMILKTANEGPVPVWKVEQEIAAGNLTKTQGAAYVNRFHSDKLPRFDPTAYATALRAVESYNRQDDPYMEGYAALTGELLGLSSKHSEYLLRRLQRKLDLNGSETEDFVLKRVGDMFQDNFFSGGVKPETKEGIAQANLDYANTVEEARQLMQRNPNAPASQIIEELFKMPTSRRAIIAKAKEVSAQLQTVDPSDAEKKQALNSAMFQFFQSEFPSITEDMTEEEAVRAAAQDAGSLTPEKIRDIRRLYRRMK